jgi:hypothetical protein
MKVDKYNSRLLGGMIGILAPLVILYGVNVFNFSNLSFAVFLKTGFQTALLAPYLKIGALFNLAPFFIFINMNRLKTCQGIVFATIMIGLLIVYFTLS